jgi:predicted dehydrogenase
LPEEGPMGKKVNFGILGCGIIASKFCADLTKLPDARAVACGSRSPDKAARFAADHRIPKAYGTYAEMLADPGVHVVYVASPHSEHCAHTLLCLEAGKHVLCEKPLAVNRNEAVRMADAARTKKLFLMEAMWMRFLPVIVKVREWVADGLVGEVLRVTADFGFRAPFDPSHRLFNPALSGGALLDIGVYPLHFASLFFGSNPEGIEAACSLTESRVDGQTLVILKYPGDRLASLTCAVTADTSWTARVDGTLGHITMERFSLAREAVLWKGGKVAKRFKAASGYHLEAAEVVKCLNEGLTESPVMPLDESIALMGLCDRIREKIGVRYPGEN